MLLLRPIENQKFAFGSVMLQMNIARRFQDGRISFNGLVLHASSLLGAGLLARVGLIFAVVGIFILNTVAAVAQESAQQAAQEPAQRGTQQMADSVSPAQKGQPPEQDSAQTSAPTIDAARRGKELKRLFALLNSPKFSERQQATAELAGMGVDAIEEIQQRILKLTPEGRQRCLEVLRSIGDSPEIATKQQAILSIQRLTLSSDPQLAAHAERALKRLRLAAQQFSVERLSDLGADFQFELQDLGDEAHEIPISLTIGKDWNGTSKDLNAIVTLQDLRVMTFDHPSITDSDISHLTSVPLLSSLSIKRCPKITDACLDAVAEIRYLSELEIFYCDISEKGLKSIYDCPSLNELRLYGTLIPPDQTDKLQEKFTTRLTIKRGAFLGIRYPTGAAECRLTTVVQGSSAERAGLAVRDVIIQADGETVATPADISNVLREKKVGDMIKLKVVRAGEELSFEFKLGAWE